MSNQVSVRKSSGELEGFSEEKLFNSLKNAGASDHVIEAIITEIRPQLFHGISTKSIYKQAFRLLRKKTKVLAARYSLKQAILELGPTGFPFEKFVGEILNAQGYQTLTGQILQGRCITHEVDVVAWTEKKRLMVECKYHNTPGRICHVQVPLYIQSRFLDVKYMWQKEQSQNSLHYEGWVVTNTRYTKDAEDFGRCTGLHLVGWDYPRSGSLKLMIQQTGLFPLTALTGLTRAQKQQLIDNGVLLCKDIHFNPSLLDGLSLKPKTLRKILDEAEELSF